MVGRQRPRLLAVDIQREGHSFQVRVKNDSGQENLLRAIAQNARVNRPTQVFGQGKVHPFEARLNVAQRMGLYLEVESSSDVSLRASAAR